MTRLEVESTDGLTLEADLEGPKEPHAGLLLCHPHPRMGGTMNAPLIVAVKDELVRRRWAVLRFNFRGIGESEGEPGTGTKEVADAEGALALLQDKMSSAPIAVAGWSFGGAIAVPTAARNDNVIACAAVAPAVAAKPGVTDGLPDPTDLDLRIPVLFVCGANDAEISPADCRKWVEALPNGKYVEIGGANHFFWNKYEDVSSIIGRWLDDQL